MKKNIVLIAVFIGLAVFLMRWFRAFTPIENYQIHFLPLFGIYFGMRLYFKKIKVIIYLVVPIICLSLHSN